MPGAMPAVQDDMLVPRGAGPDGAIRVGSSAWLTWLEAPGTTSFRFDHGSEGFTARREQRPGGWYWYAYRKHAGRLHKAYLGRAPELTADRLRSIATTLAQLGGVPSGAELRGVPMHARLRRDNLPLQPTSFVGHGQALTTARRLLSTTRLLTLTGPGGVGKTRLALEVASAVKNEYSDGTWLVELAPLADPQLVPHALASVLGVHERPPHSLLATLAEALLMRQMLLVLDNCEHLLPACAELANALLRSCPDVAILATSRAVLDVAGETSWRVPSLTVPGANEWAPIDVLAGCDAVRLFLERSQAALPEFSLDERNVQAAATICMRLDGLPLAIELASARVRTLAPEQIAERLDDSLGLLVHGPRTAPARQQTLRATLDWSYALLAEPERRLFERVSVFAGGWTLEGAETVCADEGVEVSSTLDDLSHRVDHSLVVAEPGDQRATRFGLLEPLRQYAAERLEQRGDVEDARRRHAAHYRALVEQLGFQWSGGDLPRLRRMDVEHDNARTALRWSIDHGDAEAALRLAGAMAYYWQHRGYELP
jgi:predicted ATPase